MTMGTTADTRGEHVGRETTVRGLSTAARFRPIPAPRL